MRLPLRAAWLSRTTAHRVLTQVSNFCSPGENQDPLPHLGRAGSAGVGGAQGFVSVADTPGDGDANALGSTLRKTLSPHTTLKSARGPQAGDAGGRAAAFPPKPGRWQHNARPARGAHFPPRRPARFGRPRSSSSQQRKEQGLRRDFICC